MPDLKYLNSISVQTIVLKFFNDYKAFQRTSCDIYLKYSLRKEPIAFLVFSYSNNL